ncbi:hypothetical protein M409DRAFT_56008 [Zasmidium cellare ATCC 36951]|uniref:Uncharacterized protein n=1 Tax=Zasmidium cellare ATCC 36951 TaxID=1080233 RepID=A0A6A6CD40_ZASCE|nr:uncharacterized protein M409DRAFT_56008 [Zasmidium cellare ATCC 36951]KAF2165117.1 hypothetical protein M409DRAFT_56008 [Zasmidium cellare ATCC 36951]
MSSNDTSRDPRLSRNDPRLQNKKRVASQSPASAMQPTPKNVKPATASNSSNTNTANGTATQAPTFDPPRPPGMAPPPPQTAPSAFMSSDQPASEHSVLRDLPAQPNMFDLLRASSDITGKLTYARVERDKTIPPLQKALKEYETLKPYFEDFAAMKEMHTSKVRRARNKHDRAQKLVIFFEQESAQLDQLVTTFRATTPNLGAALGMPTDDSVPQQITALRDSYNALKGDVAAESGRNKRDIDAQKAKLANLTQQLDLLKDKQDHSANQFATATAGMAQLEKIQHSLAEVTEKVTKLEAEAGNKDDGLGLVQFTPVVAPEEPDPELSQIQQIWSTISHLEMATANHKKQLDNITTDDVVNQMVNVMGQHWPDAKNCQATVDSLKDGIAKLHDHINQVSARVNQGQNGVAKAEIDKLRGELDQVKQKVGGHDELLNEGKQTFNGIADQVNTIRDQVAKLEGNQDEAIRNAFG